MACFNAGGTPADYPRYPNSHGCPSGTYNDGNYCCLSYTACGRYPDYYGRRPAGSTNNNCGRCCSDAARDACSPAGRVEVREILRGRSNTLA